MSWEDKLCQCGHTKVQHDSKTRGCKHVASVQSRAQKQYGSKRRRLFVCPCNRFRLLVTTKEEQ